MPLVCQPSPEFLWLAVLAAVERAVAVDAALFFYVLVLPVVGSVQVTRSLTPKRALPTENPQLPAKGTSYKRRLFFVSVF